MDFPFNNKILFLLRTKISTASYRTPFEHTEIRPSRRIENKYNIKKLEWITFICNRSVFYILGTSYFKTCYWTHFLLVLMWLQRSNLVYSQCTGGNNKQNVFSDRYTCKKRCPTKRSKNRSDVQVEGLTLLVLEWE